MWEERDKSKDDGTTEILWTVLEINGEMNKHSMGQFLESDKLYKTTGKEIKYFLWGGGGSLRAYTLYRAELEKGGAIPPAARYRTRPFRRCANLSADFYLFLFFFVSSAITVDWIADNLYYAAIDRGVIVVSRLDGRYPTILVRGIDSPRALANNPLLGYGMNHLLRPLDENADKSRSTATATRFNGKICVSR